MTRDSDFKKLVRERMAATGQNYTAARAEVLAGTPEPVRDEQWLAAEKEHQLVIGRFFRDGRLTQVPMKRKVRASVLLELVRLFEPARDYPEREVNEVLGSVHEDHAFWRRELVNYGYLTREAGVYRLPEVAPERPASMLQEIPAWEELWLPTHLAGRRDDAS